MSLQFIMPEEELKLLNPWRDQLPKEIFTKTYQPPVSDGSGVPRDNLRVAKKILENWIYWFVVDFVSVFLFFSRELYPTAILFVIYLIIIVFGYKAWLKSMNTHEQY